MIKRIFVEKMIGFNTEANELLKTFVSILNIGGLDALRVIYRYDIEGLADSLFEKAVTTIFSEPNTDTVVYDAINFAEEERVFAVEFLPGQFDQHAASAAECVQIISGEKPKIRVAKLYVLKGEISDEDYNKAIKYMINPVDSRMADLNKRDTLNEPVSSPRKIKIFEGFRDLNEKDLQHFKEDMGFAMSYADILHVQKYFKDGEKRDPSLTELKVIDTYWSDHCRHTTFSTVITEISFEENNNIVQKAYEDYLALRKQVYGDGISEKPITLMDLAVIGTKVLKAQNLIKDIDESEEINACSINITVNHDGVEEPWLLMFKNETHNHPTEIEPFGGAATCLGGAIRDPLSGRSYVYQAMRLTGAWDPRVKLEDTLPGKLPQRKICMEAAQGYSSYGNQIGLATGQVTEIYHPGFLAKRMEVGAVIAAAPKKNVIRERPAKGDVILLVGGKTGRDGMGGATGSSKVHTEASIHESGAEVQKGNPVEERKIQRLFRNEKAATLIKRCNDFGAGGVSVAIGELAESLIINLDAVPKKYEGLDGTDLAISESQERMAVVVSPENVDTFIALGNEENIEVTRVAEVTDTGRLIMTWKGEEILNLSRAFLDTNGAKQYTQVTVASPNLKEKRTFSSFQEGLSAILGDINIASQKGLGEMFDGTIGAGTVVMPYGGAYALTPQEGMVAKIPVESGDTDTVSLMTFGYNPWMTEQMPYKGGEAAVVESISKLVALGGDYKKARLSFQEYFERLGDNSTKWGKPFGALLGALNAQLKLGIPAIGGKDSMSGTFENLTVPPTIISFAVCADKIDNIVSAELKRTDSNLYLYKVAYKDQGGIDFINLKSAYELIRKNVEAGNILSAKSVGRGGVVEALVKMAMGNKIGVEIRGDVSIEDLFSEASGSILVETKNTLSGAVLIGKTKITQEISYLNETIDMDSLVEKWQQPLREVFPEKVDSKGNVHNILFTGAPLIINKGEHFAAPRVLIPTFPGSNCEVDSAKAFEAAGAKVDILVFKNRNAADIENSINKMVAAINNSQIIMIPGGFSAGDQPNGSGKFIATVFRNEKINAAINHLLDNRDGLMLGICNGFQALIKLGLVPYGKIVDIKAEMPTLTYNQISRHVSTIPLTKVVSKLSPWLSLAELGGTYRIPMSHGEGRFMATPEVLKNLEEKGCIATQYVDAKGNATMDGNFNPNGSIMAIEGITSEDGRVFGKMGHSERIGNGLYKNIPGETDQKIFESGVLYFK